jgi:iron complex outermembrane recepter protein
MKTVARLTAAGLLACVGIQPLFAQGLEEIIVTATRREKSLQDVPISVTVMSGDAISAGGFSDVEDLSAFLPNLTISDGFQGQTLLIRGIGTDTRNEAFEQAVAQFSDGVYYGRDYLVLGGLFDLERIEVVRGPQPYLRVRARRPARSTRTAASPEMKSTATSGSLTATTRN